MLCRKPYSPHPGLIYGCGQCLHCRINRSRQWKWRQYLESVNHEHNGFFTLTYADEHLPASGLLEPRALQLFIKRVRKAFPNKRVRFYGVGEYGPQTRRPHFHVNLFGVSGFSVLQRGSRLRAFHEVCQGLWPSGFVHVGEFNHVTAEYVAGYVTKKLTDRKEGFEPAQPEFARMSNRPGIGAQAMSVVARQLLGHALPWSSGDVPSELRIGNRKAPLGRYLLHRLRKEVGFTDEYISELKACKSEETILDLLALFQATPNALSIREAYLQEIEGRLINVECRHVRSTWRSKPL